MRSTAGLLLLVAVFLLCRNATAQEPSPKKQPTMEVASLGVSTRAPTKDEAEKLGLKFEVRVRGQIVAELIDGGAASKSGVVGGDVIVKLGKVDVFSQDDVADVLRLSSPGQKIETTVLRASTKKEEVLLIALSREEVAAPESARLEWQFASLASLQAALAKAKEEKKLVLVGLSGAET